MTKKRKIIVLMPVKNEAWILPMSLQAASIWADRIIVSDQGSTDGSKEIAKAFPKVYLIENDAQKDFNEYQMREPLISTARQLDGDNNVLIAIDADEVLTPYFESIDFEQWQILPRGTVIQFFWGNLLPGFDRYWPVFHQNFGYVDDGKTFDTGLIHVPRLFVPSVDNSNVYECQDLGVMHFQYVDWQRMSSKHRWYQCYERIHFPQKSAVEIYRRYHHMYNPQIETMLVPKEWKDTYLQYNVDIKDVRYEQVYWWDGKVMNYFDTYGEDFFSQIDVWGVDGNAVNVNGYKYMGGVKDKILLLYLRRTTTLVYRKGWRKLMRYIDKLMILWTHTTTSGK